MMNTLLNKYVEGLEYNIASRKLADENIKYTEKLNGRVLIKKYNNL